jgi:LuxR family transcriptional regulator, maltose regulon positive regulatory protein
MRAARGTPDSRGKTAVPAPSLDVRPRPHVIDLLARATGGVAVVSAPAGYGKTSQVAAWVAQDGRAVAWADLEAHHNDPVVLLDLLVGVLSAVTDLDAAAPPGARASVAPYETVMAPELGRLVRRCAVPFVLVLDDVHSIESQGCTDVLDALVRNVPPMSTVVLVGRAVPPVSLAACRVQQAVVDVTAAELALDVPDAAAVLGTIGVQLGDDELRQLVDDTEGWPVGIRLAGLALHDDVDGSATVGGLLRGSDRTVGEYVHEEWLRGLSAADVDFLTRISGLDWVSGPLCDGVLDRSNSGDMLQRLQKSRLIVIPLDRRGDSYRLHRLLRDVLETEFERTDRDGRRRVDVRASEWFEATGDIDRAVHHAMRADDLVRAERLVAQHAPTYHTNGRPATIHRWIEAFPSAYIAVRPSLCLAAAIAALGLGDGHAAVTWVRFCERALRDSPAKAQDPTIGLQLAVFRASISTGAIGDALDDAEAAYRGLPPGLWHVAACHAHGALSFAVGDDDIAADLFTEGATEARLVAAPTLEAQCRAHLAVVLAERDDWSKALLAARSARQMLREHDLETMPTLVLVTAVSALIEAMDGDPELARTEALLTRRNLRYLDAVAGWSNVQARIALARASLLLGDRAGARTFLDEALSVLGGQADAIRPKQQIAQLDEQLRTARSSLPYGPSSLTTAELRVLHYLPTNLTHAEIAERLFVSRNTAKSHAAAVYRKLGAASRSEAVELARASGLLPAGDAIAAMGT